MASGISKSKNQIIFLLVLLITIIAIMIIMKTGKMNFYPSSIPDFDEPVNIIENTYYNKIYHFSISLPSADWEFFNYENIDSLQSQNPEFSLIQNVNTFAQMCRRDLNDTLSIVDVGIIDLKEPRIASSVAQQSLSEIISNFSAPDSVRLISEVTLTGASKLRGAYYIVEFPDLSQEKFPIMIAMFLVHNRLGYTIICRVRTEDYELLISDFEKVLMSFRIFG